MANPISSLIGELHNRINTLTHHEGDGSSSSLLSLLKSAQLIVLNNPVQSPKELSDVLSALLSQHTYTSSTLNLLPSTGATLEDLTTAVNLIQLYFQVTQPLDQILSNLVDNLPSSLGGGIKPIQIEESIKIIRQDRINLRKAQSKILREFESDIDEQKLQVLLQRSNDILGDLQIIQPGTNAGLVDLLQVTDDFIGHLQKAQELFKTFSRQGEAFRDSEAGEVEQLIRNWRDAIKAIEELELNDDIRGQLNKAPDKSRQAIAQSIQIHDLLEENYSFLSDLIRSGDLVSPGVL